MYNPHNQQMNNMDPKQGTKSQTQTDDIQEKDLPATASGHSGSENDDHVDNVEVLADINNDNQ